MKELLNEIYRYLIPALCIIIAAYCVKHLLSSRAPKVTPAYFYDEQNGKEYPSIKRAGLLQTLIQVQAHTYIINVLKSLPL